MAKKGKPDRANNAPEPSGLKHNPFAALAGQLPVAAPSSPPSTAAPDERTAEATVRSPLDAGAGKAVPSVPSANKAAKSRGRLVLRRETKHRGGKAVIIVRGFAQLAEFADDARVAELAKELKQKLGCGGTVEHGDGETEIVLQGDRAAKVAELLRGHGFRVDGVTT